MSPIACFMPWQKSMRSFLPNLIVVAGIVLPVLLVIHEHRSHLISACCFDPIPTPDHAALILGFSVANMLLWGAGRWKSEWLQGGAVAVAMFVAGPLLFYVWAIGLLTLIPCALRFILDLVFQCFYPHYSRDIDGLALPWTPMVMLGPFTSAVCMWMLMYRQWRTGWRCGLVQTVLVAGCFAAGVASLARLELPRAELRNQILTASAAIERGETVSSNEVFDDESAKQIVGRLCFASQQHTSPDTFSGCGPVDVMGPLSFILNNREIPIGDLSSPLRNRALMRKLYEQLYHEKPEANSWRGLSPWEIGMLDWRNG